MNTRPTYEPSDLIPQETNVFTKRAHRQAKAANKRRRDWGRTDMEAETPPVFDAPSLVMPTAVAAIRKAFLLARTSHEAWRSYKREGRFDVRSAPRARRMEMDVFKKRAGASTTRVKCSVLIDASGSMATHGSGTIQHPDQPEQVIKTTAAIAAAVFGATIAKALGQVPTVNLDLYQHGAASGRMAIKWRWTKGTPTAVFNDAIYHVGGGGNADGHALYAVTERMRRDIKRGERGVIMVVSDGLPSQYSHDGRGGGPRQALIDAVAHARKAGFDVIAVAIDGSDQSTYYGAEHVVPFTGSWTALGSALARHIGAALAAKR